MTTYYCELCKFETRIKTHLKTHHNTRKHKSNEEKQDHYIQIHSTKEHKTNNMIAQKSTKEHIKHKKFRCEHCLIFLKTKANLTRHLKHYCKSYIPSNNVDEMEKKIKNIEELLEDQQKQHDKEKKLLYKQIEKLLDKVGNTTNIQHNNIESNIQTNIILNNYGKEDLSHITDTFKDQLIKIPYSMIPKMIEAVHFNDKKPENKNISLTNKKDNLIKIFKNNKWIYQGKEETINSLVDGKYCILDSYYEDNFENSDMDTSDIEAQRNEITKTNYGKFRQYFEKSDKELIEKLKKECEIVLLNNR